MTHTTWAKQVKELDGNKCAYCGSEIKLEAHHIKSRAEYPELVFSLENGVTLCHECHYSVHGGHYGKRGHSYRSFTVEPKKIVVWLKEYCDMRIVLTVLKGEKAKIKAHAESMGESVNGFINRAIENQIEDDKKGERKENA